ncbi:MAG: 2,3-bisphosphoglycerate-independent phosphoglycerate mutase [Pseudomonadota bacterium]|nr:2,3-bisphosphoglycerate-independent phosphoglycerate mutase [Pseudomonadota bacterium]
MGKQKNRVLLVILDGWGHSKDRRFNAILSANTPNWDKFLKQHPNSKLKCSGTEVGLPVNQMGNSEVGHMHMGAGRLIRQDLSRINKCISDNKLQSINCLVQAFDLLAKKGSTLHLLGLLSPGGVHSHIDHLESLIALAEEKNVRQVLIHGFLDGRDTAPKCAADSITRIETLCNRSKNVKIASIVGRYYAMDRNGNWDRTKLAHDLITQNKAIYKAPSALEGLLAGYARGETDEFIQATKITGGVINPNVEKEDIGLFTNFRADRARQLTASLANKNFVEFARDEACVFNNFITMTNYGDSFDLPLLFPQPDIQETLGQIISDHKLYQIRIAETEKYAHVTFFFNGGREQAFPREKRILIPSPDVATYDLKPEMSALEVTDAICKSLRDDSYDVIISNFANADMVGHTGVFDAAVRAVETLDNCLGTIAETAAKCNVQLLITADHGNVENMCHSKIGSSEEYSPHTAHTNNTVPLVYLGPLERRVVDGQLKDIAPTILELLGIDRPRSMTGNSLFRYRKQLEEV